MTVPILTDRALNRALLARQLLLDRHSLTVEETVERLVGMQAQAPLAAYVGLWSRLRDASPQELARALEDRALVRTTLMRGTVHLVTVDDALTLRPLTEPAIARGFRAGFVRRLADDQEREVVAFGRELLSEAPRTRAELRSIFRDKWPDGDADAMAYAVSYLLPTVQPTPRGVWGRPQGAARLALLDDWVGRPLDPAPSIDRVVLRYLRAFGPATVGDVQAWSGLTRLGEVIDRLAPQLRVFASESGATLYDIPEAPRPDEDLPAPPRFLPEYDNVLFAHRDRRRIHDSDRRIPLPPGAGARGGTLLVDGYFRGTWRLADDEIRVTLAPLTRDAADAVQAEGARLASFLGAGRKVRIESPRTRTG